MQNLLLLLNTMSGITQVITSSSSITQVMKSTHTGVTLGPAAGLVQEHATQTASEFLLVTRHVRHSQVSDDF